MNGMAKSRPAAGCLAALLAFTACDTPAGPSGASDPPSVALAVAAHAAEVGRELVLDLAQGGRTFTSPAGWGLTYTVAFEGPSRGLRASGSSVTGVPAEAGVIRGTITARDASGRSAATPFRTRWRWG
jgi:hypothetical protein